MRRSEHIADALFSLHWLRVPKWIVFKVAMLTFSCRAWYDAAYIDLAGLKQVRDFFGL